MSDGDMSADIKQAVEAVVGLGHAVRVEQNRDGIQVEVERIADGRKAKAGFKDHLPHMEAIPDVAYKSYATSWARELVRDPSWRVG